MERAILEPGPRPACPDEDTFARLVEGLLPAHEAAAIEAHVDGCTPCADLVAAFGRLYAPRATGAGADDGGQLLVPALVASAVLHAAWAVVVARVPPALAALAPAGLAAAYQIYAAICGPLGVGAALFAALALRRRWPGGRAVALVHAVLALPSVALTPLATFVLFAARGRGATSGSPSGRLESRGPTG